MGTTPSGEGIVALIVGVAEESHLGRDIDEFSTRHSARRANLPADPRRGPPFRPQANQ